MLSKLFTKLQNTRFKKIIQKIFDSKWLVVVIAFLALISNIFSFEIYVLYIYALIVAMATLFSDDLLCLLPIACCSYYTFSKKNNPLAIDKTSVFLEETAKIHLLIIILITAVSIISRLIFEIITKEEKRKLPKLTWGFLAVGLSYVLGGLLSEYYDIKTIFFGFVQICALSFCYFYFYMTVDFKKVKKTYFAYLVTIIGVLLVFESLGMLYYSGFFTISGYFTRNLLYTGWGTNNNVAACLCMCLPAPFYYAITKKQGWLYLLLSNVFLVTLVFIQSRNGILFGILIFIIMFISSIVKTSRKNRISLFITQIVLVLIYTFVSLIFKDILLEKFMSIISSGLNDSGRFKIYFDGLKQFLEYPIFGNGFYKCNAYRWGDNTLGKFLPPRYHNIYVQLLASCGIVSLATYLYHRFETIKLMIKKFNIEKYVIFMIAFSLVLTSILDNHFFNFGPGFTYSAMLLLLEIDYIKNKDLTKC